MMRFIAVIIGVFLLVGVALSGSYVFDAYLSRPSTDVQMVTFVVPQGQDVSYTVKRLKETGVIESVFFFKVYLRFSGADRAFQSGTFELKPGMSFRTIARTLSHADTNEVQITIPEGFTLKQIGERVRAALPQITEEQWNVAAGVSSPASSLSFVAWAKPNNVDLEGYLFPDTYRFFADATADDVVRKMVEQMDEQVSPLVEVQNGMTAHEMLTLASIIEREVQDPKDMKDVADIFLKRLEMGMPLQADSTISYYLGKTSAELTTDDLKSDEPFNTYTRAGLPPGPISNPGLNAIEAVVYPTENPYLYFLTTDDGTVIYAATFEEHVANKQRYLN